MPKQRIKLVRDTMALHLWRCCGALEMEILGPILWPGPTFGPLLPALGSRFDACASDQAALRITRASTLGSWSTTM